MNKELSMTPKAILPRQAAELLGIGKGKIYELIHQGKIRTIRVGRRFVVPVDALDQFLAGSGR